MVESMIRYSKSGSSTNALKRLFQTPFFAHRRKRWNSLFQLPNSLGRSRHGAPARTSQSTASTNNRLSSPCRPLSPSLPGISSSMRRHCSFESDRRIKIALLSCDLGSHLRVGGNPLYVNRTEREAIIFEASDRSEATRIVKQHGHFDLILLDLELSDTDGFRFLRKLEALLFPDHL